MMAIGLTQPALAFLILIGKQQICGRNNQSLESSLEDHSEDLIRQANSNQQSVYASYPIFILLL
jgi:hypothetical protein